MAGAEVIKVESRDRPDIFRVLGQRYGWDVGGTVDESPPFTELSAGKKSLTFNLKHPTAVELILRIVAGCQVVTEAFRPGVMDRLGLGADALRRANPELVVISLSGWGPGTAEHAQAGYAPVFAAYSGLSEATGYPDGAPSAIRQPMDVLLGTHGVLATMAGLINARRTGAGAHISVAGVDAAALSVADLVVAPTMTQAGPARTTCPGVRMTAGWRWQWGTTLNGPGSSPWSDPRRSPHSRLMIHGRGGPGAPRSATRSQRGPPDTRRRTSNGCSSRPAFPRRSRAPSTTWPTTTIFGPAGSSAP
jgi:crotonobetainyl-CoA:carnitine CoA-transferase CaiB-like acyl-CoA transferase